MADEDEEYSYQPNQAVMGAVMASQAPRGLQTGGLRAGGGLGAARPDAPNPRAALESQLAGLRPKQRAAALAGLAKADQAASHNAAMEAVARAKLALDQSHSYYENAKTRNELIQQANQLNESAGFLAEHANLNPYAPDYYSHVNKLSAKYPGADGNKIVQTIVNNPKLREQAALKGDLPGEVMTQKALQTGFLRVEDFSNPQLRNEDGSLNHDAAAQLASLRQGASVEPPHVKAARQTLQDMNKLGTDLSPEQEQLAKMSTNTLLQFQKGQQATLGIPQPPKVTAASFLPRSGGLQAVKVVTPNVAPAIIADENAPIRPAPPLQSIPKAPAAPTPAPTPISPEKASEYLNKYF